MGTPIRILAVRAGALGDTLMATPVIRGLRSRYPGAEIHFLSSDAAAPLLEMNPHISRLWVLRHRNVPWVLSTEKRRLTRQLRQADYAFAVLLESAPRYREILERAGIREIRSFRETPFNPNEHSIVNNLRAAGLLDTGLAVEDVDMDLPVTPQDREIAEGLLAGLPAPLAGLHAGYGPRGGKKNQGHRLRGWGAQNFAELGAMLLHRGFHLVLTGSPEDREEAEAIASRLPAGSFLQLAGCTSVRQLAAVIRQLNLYISVDSGPAHIAAAVGTPLVVIWGPGILEQTRPVSTTTPIQIVRHQVFCAPCYGTAMMRSCQRNICMEGLSPRRVFDAAAALQNAGNDKLLSLRLTQK